MVVAEEYVTKDWYGNVTEPQYCASSTDKFYLVTDPTQTLSAFNSIGPSLAKLRVAK